MGNEPATSRYVRQMTLPGIGEDGQKRLGESHAMVIGCGALGCTSADLLVRAGVGRVTVIDRDLVEHTNLHRQCLFTDADAENHVPKASAAQSRLCAVNPQIRVLGVVAELNSINAEVLIEDGAFGKPDVIVDGTDNFETRYLLNDLSVMYALPYVYGGAVGTSGMVAVFRPETTACLRCVFDEIPAPGSQPTCTTAGVLAPVSSVVASFQAAEAIKILVGADDAVTTDLLMIDGWHNTTKRLSLLDAKDPECVCCAGRRFEFLDATNPSTVSLCGRQTIQITPGAVGVMDLVQLRANLAPHGEFEGAETMLRGRFDAEEGLGITIFGDGRALIEGTDDPGVARAVYDRYIGT
ncbi:MAG: ThiF family adenylyltransferase [Phycisphaerales bacterium]|nr:ThiF family adenylyltransferase [Phycisphaerales bacterium]